MKERNLAGLKASFAILVACIALGGVSGILATRASAQTPPNLPPGVVDVIGLTKAGFGEDGILAKVKKAGVSYDLTAEQMIYLKNQGVSENVISALLQAGSASTPAPAVSAPPVTPPPPSATPSGSPSTPAPASAGSEGPPEAGSEASSTATTAPPPPPSAATQEDLVQEHNGYTFELKECKVKDRQDRPANDGKPHQQLVCKVLVTDKMGGRTLVLSAWNGNEHTRVIDDMGNEYDCVGGSLGTSGINEYWGKAENVLPSGVAIKGVLFFAVRNGIGYFSPDAKSLGVLDVIFTSNDTGGGPFHVQFKNVPLPLVEAPPVRVATAQPPVPVSGGSIVSQAPAPPAEPVVNADYVQQQLSPYGSWVDVPGYGQCWQPAVLPSGWRPYYDSGHWVYTDAGLYWQSDYPWGAIPFHYGSWTYAGGYGWVWVPGYEYAPARVFWRHADGYLGWAPLPPGAVFVDGGWMFRGRRFAVDYDFGFGASFFVFVDSHHLWEHDYHRFILRGDEFHRIYGRSEISRLRRDEHGRFVHEGLDREHLERLTGRKVDVVRHEEARNREREVMRTHYAEAVEKSRSRPPTPRPGDPKAGEPRSGQLKPGEPKAGEPRSGQLKPGEPKTGEPRPGQPKPGEKPDEKHKEDKKDQNQSKGNTNQHFAQLKGSSGT